MREAIVALDTEEIEALSTDVLQGAAALVVADEDGLKLASFILGGIKGLLDEAEKVFRPNINRWHRGHRAAIEEMNQFIGPLVAAQLQVKGLVGDYHNRLRAEADAARRVAEAKARALEEEQRLAAAVQLEEAGHGRAAEVLLEAPAPVARPMISTPPPPKTKGMGTSTRYTAEVVDLEAMVAWVVATRSWDLIAVNQRVLNKYASAEKDGFDIPGCRLYKDTQVSSRRV
jgi:hypothetical protein